MRDTSQAVRGVPRRFSAAVIGLGRIGQGYDYDRADDTTVLTHASGFAHHPGYRLIAGVDPDAAQRERFACKFGQPAYADVPALLAHHRPEVVSIGVPTDAHCDVFEAIMAGRPAAVLCEKPIALRVADAKRMVAAAERNGCALAVNYMRRFEPGTRALKEALDGGELGDVYKGIVWYSKGLRHNGSHFVDLLRFLLGDATGARLLERGRVVGNDVEPDVSVRFGHTPVLFLATREECFSIAEMILVGTRGVIRYADGGARITLRTTDAAGALGPEKPIPGDLGRYQWHVMDALHRHLTEGAPLASDGCSATVTLAVVEDIFELRERQHE